MLHNHIVVTVLHNIEVVDWNWISNPYNPNFGEEYPIYEDDPFFVVEIFTERYGTVTYGELPKGSNVKDVEYHIASDMQELCSLVPEWMFGEILSDMSGGDF